MRCAFHRLDLVGAGNRADLPLEPPTPSQKRGSQALCHVPPFLWCADVMHWCTIVYKEMSHTVLRLEENVPWLLSLGSTRPTSDTTVKLFALSTIVICFAFDARCHALPHRLTQL